MRQGGLRARPKRRFRPRTTQSHFAGHLAVGDFYQGGQKVVGEWFGASCQNDNLWQNCRHIPGAMCQHGYHLVFQEFGHSRRADGHQVRRSWYSYGCLMIELIQRNRACFRFRQGLGAANSAAFAFHPHEGRKCLFVAVAFSATPTNSAKLSQRTVASFESLEINVKKFLKSVNIVLICSTNGRRTTQLAETAI